MDGTGYPIGPATGHALRSTAALLALISALCLSTDARAAEPAVTDPSIEPFIAAPLIDRLTLSPDGTRVAGVGYNGEASALAVYDVAGKSTSIVVAPRATGRWVTSPTAMSWVGNDCIAVSFDRRGVELIDLQGRRLEDLGDGLVHRISREGKPTDWVLVKTVEYGDRVRFERVDIRTGARERHPLGLSDRIVDWTSDREGAIRMVATADTPSWRADSRVTRWYRERDGAPWQNVDERPALVEGWQPLVVPQEPGRIVVLARNGQDTLGVWSYDVGKHAFGELMAAHDTDDIVDVRADGDEVRSVTLGGLVTRTIWFDARMGDLQDAVDKALPGRVNLLSGNVPTLLIFSYSDRDPGRWYVLDTRTSKLADIGARRPQVDPARMQPMQTMRYPSFDGLSIPAYLTLPAGATQPAPLVVLIHGGPRARDQWGWDADVQALAARGYAVFQPQFRGSSGFGRRFEEAGFGQWGLAMEDDISSGVKYLVDHGIADPDRICIVGASYGGYAALWGLAKTPDLYKCGVSFAGVSDIGERLDDDSDTNLHPLGRALQGVSLGVQEGGGQDFDGVSPLKHADRIRVPVLIVHGRLDRRVPIAHGERMARALEKLGRDVRTLWFDNEGHGLAHVENRRAYYEALFALLDRTIGKGAATRVARSPGPEQAASGTAP